MARVSLLPNGHRLGKNFQGKMKCLELLPPTGGNWCDIWNTAWNGGATIYSQLSQIAKLGASHTKITMEPYTAPASNGSTTYPSEAVYRPRRQQFFQWCRQLGLRCYRITGNEPGWLFGGPGAGPGPLGTTVTGLMPTHVASIEQDASDIVDGIDVCNEMDDAPATGWANGTVNAQMASDMLGLVSSVRAVSKLPLTASIQVASASDLGSNSYIDLQYNLALDFHDIHLYYRATRPAGTDGAVLESRAKFLGSYIIGEMGRAISNGAADQLSWFNGIGDIQRRPLCKGTVMFGLTNFDTAGGTDDYGMYLTTDTAFTAPRQGMLMPFQNWVGL